MVDGKSQRFLTGGELRHAITKVRGSYNAYRYNHRTGLWEDFH